MGYSRTPKYRYHAMYRDSLGRTRMMVGSWDRSYGRPTEENAGRWARTFADSTKIGGCNEAMGKAEGCIVFPNRVEILRQSDRYMVASWSAPAFQVI